MNRRLVLPGLVVGSLTSVAPGWLRANVLVPPHSVLLRCLGTASGSARFLDGRTGNGTVGLAPEATTRFSGTKWNVRKAGDGIVALQCVGTGNGPKWLDGRTADGTVGLAPSIENPFTGTRWEVVSVDDNNPDIVALKCLATIEGARWLDGRTGDGSVGLAPTTDAPFTGTKWEVKIYPALM